MNKSLVPSLDDRYKVIFVPVISRGNEEDYNEGERLVIQISVSPSLTSTLHFVISKNSDTDNGKSETCYVSRDGHCVKVRERGDWEKLHTLSLSPFLFLS